MTFLILSLGTLYAQNENQKDKGGLPALVFYYELYDADLSPDSKEGMDRLIDERINASSAYKYILIQGFACDTGGIEASYRMAGRRAMESRAWLLHKGIDQKFIHLAKGIVLTGSPKDRHRRVEIYLYRDQKQFDLATKSANQRADKVSEIIKAREGTPTLNTPVHIDVIRSDKEIITNDKKITDKKTITNEPSAERSFCNFKLCIYLIMIIILALILFFICYVVCKNYLLNKRKKRHTLTAEEAEEISQITGEPTAVVIATMSGRVDDRNEDRIEENEMKKAKKGSAKKRIGFKKGSSSAREQLKGRGQKPAPKKREPVTLQSPPAKGGAITIRGAVDKEFEQCTLSELARAPVHALEGLTPRHTRMLEEAFGIRTIEDLAKLRYFELAKAITILSRYEKQ